MSSNPPRISPDLIRWLEAAYPNRVPPAEDILDHTALIRVGEQAVITRLRILLEQQEREARAISSGVIERTAYEE